MHFIYTDGYFYCKQCNVRFAFESRLHKHNRSARHIEFTGTLESIDMEASDEDLEASDEGTHGHMVSHMDIYIHVQ